MMTAAAAALALGIAAQPVPMPRYRAGDAFVFSDGHVERVVRVERDKVVWSGLSGPAFTRGRNFILPVESWRSRAGIGRRAVFGTPGQLWPYSRPGSVRFRVVAETKTKPRAPWRRSVTLWTCQSMKPRGVTLSFTMLPTVPFKCDRYSAANMRLLERIEWDYSPEIGHWVRRSSIDYLRGTKRTVDLVATLSGPAASRPRLAALARAARRGKDKIVSASSPSRPTQLASPSLE